MPTLNQTLNFRMHARDTVMHLRLATFISVFLMQFWVGAFGQAGMTDRERLNIMLNRIDNTVFWTQCDSTFYSNEFAILSRVIFDYRNLKKSQQGILIFAIKLDLKGSILSYGIVDKPNIKNLDGFKEAIEVVTYYNALGKKVTPVCSGERQQKEFIYLVYWPFYTYLPYGAPAADPSFQAQLDSLTLPSRIIPLHAQRTLQLTPEPVDFSKWVTSLNYPYYAVTRQLGGSVTLQGVVDTLGNVIRHRLSAEAHSSLVTEAVEKLYQLKFKPLRINGKAVLSVFKFTLTASLPNAIIGSFTQFTTGRDGLLRTTAANSWHPSPDNLPIFR